MWALPAASALLTWDVLTNPIAAVTALGTVQSRDTRMPSQTGLTTLGIATHQAAQLGSRLLTITVTNGVYNFYPMPPVVLSPGFDLLIGPNAVNLGASASIWGYERPAFKRELLIRS